MIHSYVDSFKRLKPSVKRKVYFILFTCFFLSLSGTVLYRYFLDWSQEKKGFENQKISPALLTLTSSAQVVKLYEPITVTLLLDSGNQSVDAADFVITYDNKFLKADALKEGTYFQAWPIKKIDLNLVKLSGVANLENNTVSIPEGKGTIGTITFIPIGIGDTQIQVQPVKTIVASKGKNILDASKLNSLHIQVK